MRILTLGNMYPPHHQGGYERAWAAVVDGLRARGHYVRVLTTTHRQDGVAEDPATERGVRREMPWYWHEHEFPRRGVRGVVTLERSAHAVLRDELAAYPADVAACFSMGGMPLSLIAGLRRAGVPVVGIVHDEWLAYGPVVDPWTRWLRRVPRPLARAVARVAGVPDGFAVADVARWSCNSAYIRDRAAAAGAALPEDRTTVDRPGIDPRAFPPRPARTSWEGRLVVVGRVVPEKGVEHAIDALARLPGHSLDVVGAGDRTYLERLRRRAAELGVSDRVSFAGALAGAALVEAYAAADAVVFPVTWAEPFGLVPLEAMAVGRPVVSTATGGAGEFLRDGANALVVPPADPQAIAEAVDRLSRDPDLRAQLRAGGTATASRHTEEGFVERVCDVITGPAPASSRRDRP